MTVTFQHVMRMLRISGYETPEAEALLERLTFPAELDDVMAALSGVGISTDFLTDRMGGNP